jgi:hypothetical protein
MKSSGGVTLCAVIVLLGSALTLLAAAGAAFMFLGPMSGQLFDPSALPPGADVRTVRAMGAAGAAFLAVLGAAGVATGIGLIRLWRWARYAAIIFGGAIVFFSVVSAAGVLLMPVPPSAGDLPPAMRSAIVGFYGLFAAAAGGFVFFLARAATAAQFAGAAGPSGARIRPLSVTVIAWLMIASGAMMVPSVLLIALPAVFLGFVLTGSAATAFYTLYMLAYLALGAGLLRRTIQTLPIAIGLHVLMIVNAVIMLVPSVWQRYHEAITSISPMFANQATMPWSRYVGVVFALAYGGAIIHFLQRARRTMTDAHV